MQILDSGEPVDLLFTDVMLPGGLNGKELAIEARVRRPGLKVLFTSGFPNTASRQASLLAPGDVLLSKPYHKQDLAKVVEEILTAAARQSANDALAEDARLGINGMHNVNKSFRNCRQNAPVNAPSTVLNKPYF